MKKYFSIQIFFLLVALVLISASSCRSKKNISSKEKNTAVTAAKQLPETFSISPNQFRAEATVTGEPKQDTLNQAMIYRLLINDVLNRGSSLTYLVARGDTIDAVSPAIPQSSAANILKNEKVIAVIEERLQLNSTHPVFILKDIHKK